VGSTLKAISLDMSVKKLTNPKAKMFRRMLVPTFSLDFSIRVSHLRAHLSAHYLSPTFRFSSVYNTS
jgi:uncharacterized protein YggT (Ycf19 family)